jgi:hypothetical protein
MSKSTTHTKLDVLMTWLGYRENQNTKRWEKAFDPEWYKESKYVKKVVKEEDEKEK